MVLSKSFRVWRKYRPRSVLLESKENPEEALLFESDTIAILSPVEVDIIRREYGENLPAYGSLGVLTVNVTIETYHYLVLITGCQSVGKLWDAEVFRITQTTFVPLSTRANLELVQDVGKLLASGRFYFAYPSTGTTFDLLSCAQKQGKEQPHFFWNKGLFAYLKRFGVNCDKWLSRVMCGSVEIQTVYAGDKQAKACLISRLSCERAGTRFNVRGTNDEGHVANFVETEQAIYVDNSVASFVQVRGLVPLFWEQPGLQTGGGMIRIKFSRGYTCSQPAFERHFEWCLLHYGPLLCLNLLGTRNQEQMLSNAFQEHVQQLSSAYCAEMVCYDYHRYCKGSNVTLVLSTQFLPMVETFVNSHGFYISQSGTVQRQQTGTLRANCLDCLDRTNSVQSFLGHHMLTQLMSALGLSTKPSVLSRFEQLFSLAWSRNGDSISRLYAGTRALALEGKMKFKDGARSVQRTILNNFMDNTKQEAIDMLLHSNSYSGELGLKAKALLDPTDALGPIPFKQSICDRWSDFTTPEKLRVCVGTWNVNGGRHVRSIALKNQSMHDWLLDGPLVTGVVKEHPEEFRHPPDIYAIGFQELVGLTASNIVSASTGNRHEWGVELQRVLSRDHPYELLTAEQLVGICLYIFIRPKLIPYTRDVAVSTVKTGMSGKAGNKGAVAIRFLLHASSLCFVCSHFAAHQSRVMERNQDFADIWKKVQFSGQSLEVHDYVFWCGDLNYRIDLPSSVSKDHIAHQKWDKLCKQDQLIKQKKLNKVFQGFSEGKMTFAPTYKYDEFSDDYDTSEKCRTPAWCDRILWRRRSFRTEQPTRTSPSQLTETNSEVCDTGEPPHWDFGLHPSDADVVCGKEMEGGGGGRLVNTGHTWHPGRLLYYNRAELKQSDHRPVVALLEVDIYRVDPKRRAEVRKEVILSLGPPDPTIVISEQEEGMSVPIPLLLDALRPYGQVVLVRMMNDLTLVTFQHSQSALAATALHGKEVGGVQVDVYLNSPWPPVSPTGDQELSRTTRESRTPRNPGAQRLKVLTSEQLVGAQETEAAPRKPEDPKDLLEFSLTEQQNLTEMEAESTMEDSSTERTGGMELEPTDELEVVQPTEMEPDDYEEVDSGESDEPEYTDEVRSEHTVRDETEPGQEDPIGTEPGQMSNSRIEQGQPNGMESGQRDELESGQTEVVESGQTEVVESGQTEVVESGQMQDFKPGQEQSQEHPNDVVVSPKLQPSLEEEKHRVTVLEEEGNGGLDPPGEPDVSDEPSEQAIKQQPEEVSELPKPPQTAEKSDPPPRPLMPPSCPSQAPPKSADSPEENRLTSRPQRPPARPRPPRPQMPMRERTKSLPRRPGASDSSSADMKQPPLNRAPPPSSENPQAPPRHKKHPRSAAELSTSQASRPPVRPTQPPKRPSHSPNVPHKHTHSSHPPQKPSKPARPPPPKKT